MENDDPNDRRPEQRGPNRSVRVEIIAYAPTVFSHCQHCELVWHHTGFADAVRREEARHALPADLHEEFQRLSEWVHSLWMRYGPRIRVKVVDAASIEGVWKSWRYRVRKYPAIVVNHDEVHVGLDFQVVEPFIERHLAGHAGR
jgi:hypothetical protein